jgi:hypothetical protein
VADAPRRPSPAPPSLGLLSFARSWLAAAGLDRSDELARSAQAKKKTTPMIWLLPMVIDVLVLCLAALILVHEFRATRD